MFKHMEGPPGNDGLDCKWVISGDTNIQKLDAGSRRKLCRSLQGGDPQVSL